MTKNVNITDGVHLLFVRHGETVANVEQRYMGQTDSPLTRVGVAQVEAVAERLSKGHIDAIYCSDLGRTVRSAEIIATACGLSVVHDSRLRERHAGLLQGKLASVARKEHAHVFAQIERMGADYAFPGGGESGVQIEQRISAFLDMTRAKHSGETVVAVTHGGLLYVLLWHILKFPYRAISNLRCDNACISAFSFSGDKWILETWNDTAHL